VASLCALLRDLRVNLLASAQSAVEAAPASAQSAASASGLRS